MLTDILENMAAFEELLGWTTDILWKYTLADEVIESCKSFLETAGLGDGAINTNL